MTEAGWVATKAPAIAAAYLSSEVGRNVSTAMAKDAGISDLSGVHPLTGPVFVKGAEPGDLLEVKLVAVEADPWEQWGYTVEVPGFGFLRDDFSDL